MSPTWTETRPALAFDQLFRTDRNRGDRRVVDAVLEDAKSLRLRLSLSDRQRFEEYLGSVHEIEGRIKRADKQRDANGWKPTLATPDRPRPADGIPADIPEYWKLMNDIVLLAFRTDTTRIATLKYCNDGSAETHTHCGAKDQHHQMAHTQPPNSFRSISFSWPSWLTCASACRKFRKGTARCSTTLRSCTVSSMLHGNHDAKQLPIILLGSAGGKLRGGRVLDYLNSPNRRMCSLFLHLMDWADWNSTSSAIRRNG